MEISPLADIEMEVGGVSAGVTVAMPERLPVSVLLGTDIPELGRLLSTDTSPDGVGEALVVTRAKAREMSEIEATHLHKKKQSRFRPNFVHKDEALSEIKPGPLSPNEDPTREVPLFGSSFAEDLIEQRPDRQRQTRREKRETCHK